MSCEEFIRMGGRGTSTREGRRYGSSGSSRGCRGKGRLPTCKDWMKRGERPKIWDAIREPDLPGKDLEDSMHRESRTATRIPLDEDRGDTVNQKPDSPPSIHPDARDLMSQGKDHDALFPEREPNSFLSQMDSTTRIAPMMPAVRGALFLSIALHRVPSTWRTSGFPHAKKLGRGGTGLKPSPCPLPERINLLSP